jgi:hypothetical protein
MESSNETRENVELKFIEVEQEPIENTKLYELINIFDNLIEHDDKQDIFCSEISNFEENYTLKELYLISDYYGLTKNIKTNKFNKSQMIEYLVNYELSSFNSEVVAQRRKLWYFMNELAGDKFMKRFILGWNIKT